MKKEKSVSLDGGDQIVFLKFEIDNDYGMLDLKFLQRTGCTLSSTISLGGITKKDIRALGNALISITKTK